MNRKEWHIFNGDVLHSQVLSFGIENKIVMRECLIEGPTICTSLNSFIQSRKEFFQNQYGIDKKTYNLKTKTELLQLQQIKPNDDILLWFEFDLFCQTNMWYLCYYLSKKNLSKNVYWVMPNHAEWSGFGSMTEEDLKDSFTNKLKLQKDQVIDFSKCWEAYQANDIKALLNLGAKLSLVKPILPNVIEAHIERLQYQGDTPRPESTLQIIMQELDTLQFDLIFREFCKREGIYGFGDLQIRRMLLNMGLEIEEN